MQLCFHRRLTGLGLAVVLAVGSACGTRLDKAEIVSAHDGTRSAALAAEPAGAEPPGNAVPGAAGAPVGTDAGTAVGSVPTSADEASGGIAAAGRRTGGGFAGGTSSAGTVGVETKPGSTGSAGSVGRAKDSAAAGAGSTRHGAATGGADGGQAAPRAGSPTAPTPAQATGAILVGAVGQTSGIVGAAVGPALPALQAWAASVNAAGGVKGHPVKLFFGDDGGDPARHRQLVQQLVERDKVIAFVMHFSPLSGQAGVDYLTKKRVPVTGDNGGAQWFYESPMYFPQMSTGAVWVRAMIYAAAAETIPQGKKKLAILNCQEAQFCVDADRLWPGLASKVGYDLVFRRQASLAQPDYTAECLGARNAGAEVFGVAMDGNAVGRVASACARVNFHPIFFIHHSAVLLDHAKDPNSDGIIVPLPTRSWFDTSNAVVAAYQKALSTYAPGAEPKSSSFAGWAAGRQFQAAANLSPDPTTSEGILEGLWSLKDETYGDITYPHTFNREKNAPEVLCFYVIRGSQGKWAYTDQGAGLRCPALK